MNCIYNGVDMRSKKEKDKTHFESFDFTNIMFTVTTYENIFDEESPIGQFIYYNLNYEEINNMKKYLKCICKETNQEYFYVFGYQRDLTQPLKNIQEIETEDVAMLVVIDAKSHIQMTPKTAVHYIHDDKIINYDDPPSKTIKHEVMNYIFDMSEYATYGEFIKSGIIGGTFNNDEFLSQIMVMSTVIAGIHMKEFKEK